jgi:sugar lactone lactonase YvrE
MLLLTAPSICGADSAVEVSIGSPAGIAADTLGNVYFSSPNLVYKLDRDGNLTRVAGRAMAGYSGDGGPAVQALLNIPLFDYPEIRADFIDYAELTGPLAVDAAGNLYIGDAYNDRVRMVDRLGTITTVAQGGWPQGVAVDANGNLYVAFAYGVLQKISRDGAITPLAGANCGPGYLGPGICGPEQIAVDAAGNVYVPDVYCRVRRVGPEGSTITVAGADTQPSHGFVFTCGRFGDDGPAARAALAWPFGVALDVDHNLYIADTYNHCIRKVDGDGLIRTVAGNCGSRGYSGDADRATQAKLDAPHAIALDSAGSMYIADTGNHRIRKVSPDGLITTIAGNGGDTPDELAVPATLIGPGFTGSWYNPKQSGHGLFVEVLPGNRINVAWVTFTPEGQQAWFSGVGSYGGNTATIDAVEQPSGGRWIPNFDPSRVVRNAWGALTLTFTDCNHGKVDFTSVAGYGTGSMDLTRLTMPSGLTCQ